MEFISGEFPSHFRTGIPLHSRNVLALLDLWHGTRKIMHKDMFILWEHNAFTLVCISQSKQSTTMSCLAQNEKYHAKKCIQTTLKSPVSVQVWGAISNRGLSFLREVNRNMDSAKYRSDIIP